MRTHPEASCPFITADAALVPSLSSRPSRSLSLTACSSDDSGGGGGGSADSINVWIVEDLPDRVAATQDIVDAFTKESGIDVELVAVAEDQFNQMLTSNAAAGDLPDVIGALPLGALRTLSSNDLVDTGAVADVIDDLERRHLQRQRPRS